MSTPKAIEVESATAQSTAEAAGEQSYSPHDHIYSVELLSRIAATYGVNVTEKDQKYWRSMWNAGRALDDLIDDEAIADITHFIDTLIQGEEIPGLPKKYAQEFSDVFHSLTPDDQRELYERCTEFPLHSKMQGDALHKEEYAVLNWGEAEVFGEIMSLPIDETAPDATGRKLFKDWMVLFTRTAYALDNLIDASRDYDRGNSSLRPTLENRLFLARTALTEMARCAVKTPISTGIIVASVQTKRIFREGISEMLHR